MTEECAHDVALVVTPEGEWSCGTCGVPLDIQSTDQG